MEPPSLVNEHINKGDQAFQITIDLDFLQFDLDYESEASHSDNYYESSDEGSNEDRSARRR